MKILLVQTAFLGDVILSTPVIDRLRNLYPEAEIWMMTTVLGNELMKFDRRLSGMITFDKRRTERGFSGILRKAREIESHGFDRVYSLHKSWRTGFLLKLARIPVRIGFKEAKLSFLYTETRPRMRAPHEVLRNLSLLEPEERPASESCRLSLAACDLKNMPQAVQRIVLESSPYIAVFPGSAWKTKRWSEEGYREAVRALSARGKTLLLLGSSDERSLCDRIAEGTGAKVFAGDLSLSETAVVVQHAAGVLTNDSMALHLASSFQIPTVAVFCATSPSFGFGPWMNRHIIIEKEGLSCKPCARHGGHVCPIGTERCMRDIDPMRVVDAIEKVTWAN